MKRVRRREARRVAIVTGGASGLGAAMARRLLQDGLAVAIFSRDPTRLRAGGSDQVLKLRVDVTRPDEVEDGVRRVKERFGRVDVLINNAGTTGPIKPVQDIDIEDWNETLAVNLTGAFLCCKFVVPLMMETGKSGRILNVSSNVGRKVAPMRTAYSASKVGLIGFTRALSGELGKFGITVNAISPGPIEGERIQAVMKGTAGASGLKPDDVKERMLRASSLHRLATYEEVAGLVSFLVSPDSGAITGQEMIIDST